MSAESQRQLSVDEDSCGSGRITSLTGLYRRPCCASSISTARVPVVVAKCQAEQASRVTSTQLVAETVSTE